MKRKVTHYFVEHWRELLKRIQPVHEERDGFNQHVGLCDKVVGSSWKISHVAEGT